MHVSFEAGMGWIHLAHKNADLLLLVSIASLGLLPLVSIYIIETEKYEESALSTTLASSRTTSEFLRSCMRGLVYLAILFPYLLALLSTYVSIQLIRGQSLDENDAMLFPFGDDSTPKPRSSGATMFWLFYRNTKVLKPDDMVTRQSDPSKASLENTYSTSAWWKLPLPGAKTSSSPSSSASSLYHEVDDKAVVVVDDDDELVLPKKKFRLVTEDCAICMHPYQAGERIVWSSNPECIHCYHYSCLQAWMEPWDSRTRRCPCCRQPFFKQQ